MKLREHVRAKRWVSMYLFAVAVIISYKCIMQVDGILIWLSSVYSVISPFVMGFGIAYILNIPCSMLRRKLASSARPFLKKNNNWISILVIYLGVLLTAALLLGLVLPIIFRNIYDFIRNFPAYYQNIQQGIDYLNSLELISQEISMETLLQLFQGFGLQNLADSLSAVVGVSSGIFRGFLAFISSVYVLAERESLLALAKRLLRLLLPENSYPYITKQVRRLNANFKQYIFCQSIDGCILGTLATLELLILRSPYALTLGIMLGIMNLIPYFGSIIGSLIAVVVVIFTQGIPTGMIALVLLIITQQIDGNLIQPRLMGGSFAISPFLIIISITIGGAIAGVLGMIVAIPVVAVLKDLADEFFGYLEQRRKTKRVQDEA